MYRSICVHESTRENLRAIHQRAEKFLEEAGTE